MNRGASTANQMHAASGEGDNDIEMNEPHHLPSSIKETHSTSNPQLKKLCGVNVPTAWHPRITIVRTTIEISILLAVMALSLQYFRSLTTVSLVPSSQCNSKKCTISCDSQYELRKETSDLLLPFRYKVKNATTVEAIHVQDITFYAQWQSCGLQQGPFTFQNRAEIHRTANVIFPFSNPSTVWDDTVQSASDDMYYYYSFDPKNLSSVHKNNNLGMTLGANIDGGYSHHTNYSDFIASTAADLPRGNTSFCFSLTCGVIDYFINSAIANSSSVSEVFSSSDYPFIQLQGSLVMTEDTVSASCVGTVYGNPIPFYSTTNSIEQTNTYLCTTQASWNQDISLSFANLIIAFGVMNFVAKASQRVSEIGWVNFISTCGARILDM